LATAVVCDDDPVARAAITVSCEEAGLEVVAETDRGSDAVELIRRFGVDVLVLDLSLGDGSGERTVEALNEEGTGVSVVVFTAYASDPWRLLRLGVREVIEKPDFELLQDVLTKMGTSIDSSAPPDDRRVASREVSDAPPMWRSPAGVSSYHDLTHSLLGMEIGDAVLAITVVGLEALETDVGPLLAADCRLAVAGTLCDELRVQDLLHEAPDISGFVALLRGGDARAAGAVWSRLTAALRTSSLPGEVKGATSRVDSMGANDALARAIGELQSAAVGTPAFISV
jgi:CheY-like chemotaxis protein